MTLGTFRSINCIKGSRKELANKYNIYCIQTWPTNAQILYNPIKNPFWLYNFVPY